MYWFVHKVGFIFKCKVLYHHLLTCAFPFFAHECLFDRLISNANPRAMPLSELKKVNFKSVSETGFYWLSENTLHEHFIAELWHGRGGGSGHSHWKVVWRRATLKTFFFRPNLSSGDPPFQAFFPLWRPH